MDVVCRFYFSEQNLATDTFLRSQMDQMSSVSVHTIAQFNRIRQHAAHAPHDTIVAMIVEACTSSARLQVRQVRVPGCPALGNPPEIVDLRISADLVSPSENIPAAEVVLPGPPATNPVGNQWMNMFSVSLATHHPNHYPL